MQTSLKLERRQQQTLSPRLQHAVRLLQMSSQEFTQKVNDVLDSNPFLETEEAGSETIESSEAIESTGASSPSAAALADQAAELAGEDFSVEPPAVEAAPLTASEAGNDPDFEAERESWQADAGQFERRSEGGTASALDLVPSQTGLRTHLHDQLSLLRQPLRDLALACAIVESLDDDGYLRQSLDEVAEDEMLDPPASSDELRIALRRVQSLDPAGVGARSVAECLQLQLPSIEDAQQRALATRIVGEHLECLAAKNIPRLAKLLGCPAEEAQAACERIRRLDPRPGWRYDSARAHYISPDVVVRRVRGQWTAMLNPAIVPRVRMNQVYAELFQRHRNESSGELAAQLQEARWTVRNIEQRFATILSVAQAVIERQRRFFELGALAMKPLCLKEIASVVGMHESTVSRVTNNKYMSTPVGVFELKYFFSRPMVAASGSTFSGTAVRELIKDMIAAEKPGTPLSDAQIARMLSQQGLMVARRTVTKYRQALHIEAVERRRAA